MSMMQKIRDVILKRRMAYRAVFDLNSKQTDIVLSDLRKFCRAHTTPAVMSQQTGTIDPVATGIAIGRLEVWHRITQHLHVSDEDMYRFVENTDQGE